MADTAHLKNGVPLKGIVVEDYVDRIIYSTIDGEKELLKEDIASIDYDEPIDNLTNLGDSAFEKGYYRTALKYYLMAQDINPDIGALNNKIYRTETIIYKTPEIQKREHLAIKNEIIAGRPAAVLESGEAAGTAEETAAEAGLKKELGLALSRGASGKFYIESMAKDSPFRRAGAMNNDVIISVWSRLCNYLNYNDLYDILTDKNEVMITVTVERKLALKSGELFDAKLAMRWEGAVVDSAQEGSAAGKAGVKTGDILVTVGGKSIRYTPLNTVLEWLSDTGKDRIISVQRRLTVFKSE